MSPYNYTLNNPLRYVHPDWRSVDEIGKNCCPDPPDDNKPREVSRMENSLNNNVVVKALLSLFGNKSDKQNKNKKNKFDTDVSFTVWGENKSGDHKASEGLIDEKSPKKSIEVDGDDVNPLNTIIKETISKYHKWNAEKVNGYIVTRDRTEPDDKYILIKYASNKFKKNVVWKEGYNNLNLLKVDTNEIMNNTKAKRFRYADSFGVDSIDVVVKN